MSTVSPAGAGVSRAAAGYQRYRTAARRASDVLAFLLAAAAAAPSALRGEAHPSAGVIALVAATALPLLVRRRWPAGVFCAVLACALATGVWFSFRSANGVAVLIALYTLAALRPLRQVLAWAGLLAVIIVTVTVMVTRGAWWYDGFYVCGLFAAALGLGLFAAARRAYLAELTGRAARLERERDQQGELAAAAERARIAREMHDIVAHNLTVMVTLSEAAIASAATSPERAAQAMSGVSATGRRALADTRRLLGVLRQDPEQAMRPVPGLDQIGGLIDQVRAAGLAADLQISGQVPDLPEGAQLTAYRLVQEALTNTLKHAGTGVTAQVRLNFRPGELCLEIDDDGIGGAGRPVPGGGLLGMQERVRAYCGDVQAGPRPPRGWRVAARLSLDAA